MTGIGHQALMSHSSNAAHFTRASPQACISGSTHTQERRGSRLGRQGPETSAGASKPGTDREEHPLHTRHTWSGNSRGRGRPRFGADERGQVGVPTPEGDGTGVTGSHAGRREEAPPPPGCAARSCPEKLVAECQAHSRCPMLAASLPAHPLQTHPGPAQEKGPVYVGQTEGQTEGSL